MRILLTRELSLLPDIKRDLMQYRLRDAQEKYRVAQTLYETGSFKDSINRSY